MARSNGRVAVVALLGACGYLLTTSLVAFVSSGVQLRTSDRRLRSPVSLAATRADVDAAEKDWKLKQWALGQMAGSAQEAAAASRAAQAEATYMALKAELEGAPAAAPAMPAPVAAAPAVAPAAVAAAPSAVSKADLAAAKQAAQLLTWSANKLMSEGAPQAAAMKAKADQAVAAFEAMKQGGAAMSVAPAAPTAPAPVAAAPVAAPVAAAASAVSKEDLAKAKQAAQLLTWSANKLMSEGAPQAAAMKAKADQAVAAFEALKQGAAAPAAQAPAAPVAVAQAAPAPVAAAAAASSPSGSSREEVLKAKKEMELHEWAAERLASSGSLQAAVMKAKAEQSRQTYEALKEQMVMR